MSWMDLKSKGLTNMPGIPEPSIGEIGDTVLKLKARGKEREPAEEGLSHRYVIGGHTASGKEFLLGHDKLRNLSLEEPRQFAISWTNYKGVAANAAQYLDTWCSSLTSAAEATKQFWPMIAEHGVAYNLLILRKVTDARFEEYKKLISAGDLEATFAPVQRAGRLFEIDFSIFESLGIRKYEDRMQRFNPATLTLLERDADDPGVFEPKWIRVWTTAGKGQAQVFTPQNTAQTPGAWLYALQAVKTSVTLYGIWLGHVYHWHMVTAAMQGTWYENIPKDHAIHQLLWRHLDYLVAFDYLLLDGAPPGVNQLINFAAIAPPSRIADSDSFLKLTDLFAKDRQFFDDDPKTELARNGLVEADFSAASPWDRYPLVKKLLTIWEYCEDFITAFVMNTYGSDQAVAADAPLQNWMKAAADPAKGNIRGLPVMNNRDALQRVLTSLFYRVAVHGLARLNSTANPVLTFVANYPPCLQSDLIPPPGRDITTKQLLTYLPNTGTIGDMLKFYFAFVFSKPYKTLLPEPNPQDGTIAANADLYFPESFNAPRNTALTVFRMRMRALMGSENLAQWPSNIET